MLLNVQKAVAFTVAWYKSLFCNYLWYGGAAKEGGLHIWIIETGMRVILDSKIDNSLQMAANLEIKKDRLSTSDTGQKTNGRWGNRTHDPLIKSQLLYQLS